MCIILRLTFILGVRCGTTPTMVQGKLVSECVKHAWRVTELEHGTPNIAAFDNFWWRGCRRGREGNQPSRFYCPIALYPDASPVRLSNGSYVLAECDPSLPDECFTPLRDEPLRRRDCMPTGDPETTCNVRPNFPTDHILE